VVLADGLKNCVIAGCPCANVVVLVFRLVPEPDGPLAGIPPRRRTNKYTSCSRQSPNADIDWTSGSKFLELACRKKCSLESPERRLAIENSDVPLSDPLTRITHVFPATLMNN
jgi:hypothetical protein